MATLVIERRTRGTVYDRWGAWSNLSVDTITDGTFVDTDTVEYQVKYTSQITDVTNSTQVVNGVSDGDGAFDVLMNSMNQQINSDFIEGRLTGNDYASVRLGSMQTALQQAIAFVLQRPLLDKQVQEGAAKVALLERQTKGFDDDAKQKLLKQALDSWSVAYSVAKDANSIPDAIKVNPIDNIMKSAMVGLGIMQQSDVALPNNPLGEV